MSNIILTPAYDYTVTTATGAAADMPVTFINKTQPSDLFQSATENSTLVIDLGTAKEVNVIAALFTNLPADATWEIRGAATQGALAAGTVVYHALFQMAGLTLHDGRSHGLYHNVNAHSYRFYQIIINAASVAGGKVQIGRLLIGKSFIPEWNNDWGAGHKINDGTTYQTMASGAVIPNFAPSTTDYSARLNYLTKDEAYTHFYDIQHYSALGKAMLVIPDLNHTQAMRDIAYGFLSAANPIYLTAFNQYSTIIKIRGIE
jgi:hypothetical protein